MENDNIPVYQMINSKLVQRPGNVRDPNRRYKSVSGTDGQYHLEFTDAEDKERDIEEAQWEADKPQREAERKAQELEADKFRESLQYENRVVAFIDILGWKAEITKSITNPELTKKLGLTVNSLASHSKMADWMMENSIDSCWPGDPQVSHFSDSIIISRVADNTFSYLEFVDNLKGLLQQLLDLNFLARGGVTMGLLYHKAAIAYGPALIRAYELEQCASYPRVILEPFLAIKWGEGVKVQDKDGNLIGTQHYWRKDEDGFIFLDFLQPRFHLPGIPINLEMVQSVLKPAKKMISYGLANPNHNLKVRQKYYWAASYFNDVCGEYIDCGVDPINLNIFKPV